MQAWLRVDGSDVNPIWILMEDCQGSAYGTEPVGVKVPRAGKPYRPAARA